VYGTTRSSAKAEMLAAQGIKPVVVDAFDAEGLLKTVGEIRPDVIFHELTDLPDGLAADQMEAALVRNARIRDEGTRNLVRAAKAAGITNLGCGGLDVPQGVEGGVDGGEAQVGDLIQIA